MNMKAVWLSLFFATIVQTTILCQGITRLEVTAKGITPISLRFENVPSAEIFTGAKELTEAYCSGLCSITGEGNRFIQVEAVQQNAFYLMEKGRAQAYDIKFVLGIKISDNRIDFEYAGGPINKHGQNEISSVTYQDFFDKGGSVKSRYKQPLQELEGSINALPMGIYEHIKKNYEPKLVSTDYERGYFKLNAKYSTWQYYNAKKEVELVVNHSTGKVMFQLPDSTDYAVSKDGAAWIKSRLSVRPMPEVGFRKFYATVNEELPYRSYIKCKVTDKKIFSVFFEVDTLGKAVNWEIKNGLDAPCDNIILDAFKKASDRWISGVQQKNKVKTKLVIPVVMDSVMKDDSASQAGLAQQYTDATPLPPYHLFAKKDNRVFTFVEVSAEPVDGLEGFYKWVGHNLRYPAQSRRMGLEGKVFVKFVIEPTGDITNVAVVKGINGECDEEAVRVISMAPKWKPGMQSGSPVRQAYTLPITFRLDEGRRVVKRVKIAQTVTPIN